MPFGKGGKPPLPAKKTGMHGGTGTVSTVITNTSTKEVIDEKHETIVFPPVDGPGPFSQIGPIGHDTVMAIQFQSVATRCSITRACKPGDEDKTAAECWKWVEAQLASRTDFSAAVLGAMVEAKNKSERR